MNSYDIDGVIYLGPFGKGLRPHDEDVIVTGRSFEEIPETTRMLDALGIRNKVYYNSLPFVEKTRETSGLHKAKILRLLNPTYHFEDDPVQAEIILRSLPKQRVIMIGSQGLVPLENVRHT